MKFWKLRLAPSALFILMAILAPIGISASSGLIPLFGKNGRNSIFTKVAKDNLASVVHIRTFHILAPLPQTGEVIPDHLHFSGTGSGVVYSKDGYILTALHVVQDVGRIEVGGGSHAYMAADMVGQDPAKDLALLKLKDPNAWGALRPVHWAPVMPAVGEVVLKLGFPGGVLTPETPIATQGIVSNTRAYSGNSAMPYGITDSLIGFGDSGGPLFNLRGEVVGIQVLLNDRLPVAYFIPSEIIRRIAPKLLSGNIPTGWLGITPLDCINLADSFRDGFLRANMQAYFSNRNVPMPSGREGVVLMNTPNPAFGDAKDLQVGDVIMRVNARKPRDCYEFVQWVAEADTQAKITVEIVRGGQIRTLALRVGVYDWVAARKAEEAPPDAEQQPQN